MTAGADSAGEEFVYEIEAGPAGLHLTTATLATAEHIPGPLRVLIVDPPGAGLHEAVLVLSGSSTRGCPTR